MLREMGDSEAKPEGALILSGRQAALADIAERRRKDPNWTVGADPSYGGLDPFSIERMTDAEFEAYEARRDEERRWLTGNRRPVEPQVACLEESRPQPQLVVRAALPFGQRIRVLRCAVGWTQREAGVKLGVSTRSIIRYEQGRSSPIRSVTLLALRRLESAHAQELNAGCACPVTPDPRSLPFP
jgi:DNA-binding XRE family transcriptional regulator